MTIPLKKITQLGLFIALGVSLGFALAVVPNVELITATCFIAGYLLGAREGLIAGIITEGLYSMLNPYGMAEPPLFIAQLLSMGLAGFIGGILGRYPALNPFMKRLWLGLSGFFLTLFFAVTTTLSFILFMGFSFLKMTAAFLYGLTFYIMHLISNTAIFILLIPILLNVMKKTGWFDPLSGRTKAV